MAKAAEEKVVMTREGYDKLKAELVSLRSDGRSEVAALRLAHTCSAP